MRGCGRGRRKPFQAAFGQGCHEWQREGARWRNRQSQCTLLARDTRQAVRISFSDGRFPGSRVAALSSLPRALPQWRVRCALRLQLRGQLRHWARPAPHSLLASSLEGRGPSASHLWLARHVCQCVKKAFAGRGCSCMVVPLSVPLKRTRGSMVRLKMRQGHGCPRNCKR